MTLLKRRSVLGVALSIAVITGVILVGSALSSPDSVRDDGLSSLDPVVDIPALLADAESALSSGDTTTTISIARQILAADPDNREALSLIERAGDQDASADPQDSGGSGSDSSGSSGSDSDDTDGSGGGDAEDPAFLEAVTDLGVLLPKEVPGYRLVDVSSDGLSTQATYDSGGATLLVSVHDRQTPGGASAFITDVSRALYSREGADVTIDGTAGYFGMGDEVGTVAYARGRYAFEVILATRGRSASVLREEAVKIARLYPDTIEE